MKRASWVLALLGLMCTPPAFAASSPKFPLETRSIAAEDLSSPYLNMAVHWESGSDSQPESLKKLPPKLPENATFFEVPLGGRKTAMLILPGRSPKLYVDTDLDDDLSDEKPIAGKRLRSGTMGWQSGYHFSPIPAPTSQPSQKSDPKIQVLFLSGEYVVVGPTTCRAGTVEINKRKYRVRLVDANYDGRYDGVMQFTRNDKKKKDEPAATYDSLAVDLNGDGEFAAAADRAAEIMPLPRMLRFGDEYYTFDIAPDGSSVTVEKADPRFGTLDVGQPDCELLLWSDTGVHHLKGTGGKWQLPEGDYCCYMLHVNRTDARKNKYTLTCRGDTGKLVDFQIIEGQTTSFKIGPPLTIQAKVTLRREMFRRTAVISASVVGQEGEQYLAGVRKNGDLVPAPAIRILDSNGKVVESGKLEYG